MLLESIRALLIFFHLLLFAGVTSLVVWNDIVILKKGVHSTPFKLVTEITTILLILLWITGLLIVYVDTQFVLEYILQKPKLVLKLLCVTVLSLNGIVLHAICFKHLLNRERLERKYAIVITVCGAVSSTHWLLAAFVGSATVLNQVSLVDMLTMYLVILCVSVLVGFAISGSILSRINWIRAHERLDNLGITPHSERSNCDAI